jgi:hypothetical protein
VILLAAALLAASPCADLPAADRALEAVEKAPEGWAAEQARLTEAFAPLPLSPPPGADTAKQIAFTRDRLHAFCDFTAAPPVAFAPPDRDRMREILARPELAGALHNRGEWFEGWLRVLLHWLEDLLGSKGAGAFASGTRALVLGLAAAVVALGTWRVLRFRRGKRVAPSRAAAPVPLRLDPPGDHLGRAQAALESDPREAIREGLLALLSCLERRRLARPDRVKTNGEIVLELPIRGASPELVAKVDPVVRWYDRTFYSLAPVPRQEASAFLSSIVGLRDELEAGA